MWIIADYRLDERRFFELTGKAMFVCQHFEYFCKEFVAYISFVKAFHEERFEFLSDEHETYIDRVLGLFLGAGLHALRKDFPGLGTQEELSDLERAKTSRNYFCHKGSLQLIQAPFHGWGVRVLWEPDEDILVEHFRNVVLGDFVISSWMYEFSEGERALKSKEDYVNSLVEWFRGTGV